MQLHITTLAFLQHIPAWVTALAIPKAAVGTVAGCLTAVSLVPQFFKSLKDKRVEGLSPLMFVVLFCGNGLWLVYGIMQNDWPIMVTNAFSVIMDAAMLILKIKYRQR